MRSKVACWQGLDAEEAAGREAAHQVILHPIKDGSRQEAYIQGCSSLLGDSPGKVYYVDTLTGLKDALEQRRVCAL